MADTTMQYIGARYVPLIIGEWDATIDYEPLSIVTYQGSSYTSRRYTPAGTQITNNEYWALTGEYNAQVAQYRTEVQTLAGRFDSIEDDATEALEQAQWAHQTAQNAMDAATNAGNAAAANTEAIAELQGLKESAGFGCGILAASKNNTAQTWELLYSVDGLNFWPILDISNMIDYNSDDYCYLFKIGDWYYLNSQHQYKSKDLINWQVIQNKPQNPYGNYRAWGFDICTLDGSTYYYVFCPAIDNNTQITNDLGTNSYVFHVWYGTATFDNETGEFTFNQPQQLTQFGSSNQNTYIDPSIVYDAYASQFVLAIKNEKTALIEVWRGSTITNMMKSDFGHTIIGCEAPKLIKNKMGEIYMYSHGYMVGGNPSITGVTLSVNQMNFRQRITRNHAVINYSEIEPIKTTGVLRHMGCIEVTNDIMQDINKIGVVPCETFRYPSSQENIYATFDTAFDEFTIYNLPGMTLYIGGGMTGKKINGAHVSTESMIPMISLSGGATNPVYGTGFRNPLQNQQIPYNGDGALAGYIVSRNPNLWSASR